MDKVCGRGKKIFPQKNISAKKFPPTHAHSSDDGSRRGPRRWSCGRETHHNVRVNRSNLAGHVGPVWGITN